MKRVLMLAAVCAAVSSAFAATTTTWTGNGADNRWGNPANWDNGVPTGSESEVATIPAGDWMIEADGDHIYYALTLAAGAGTVTLSGTGSIKFNQAVGNSSRRLTVGVGRTLVIDGPYLDFRSYTQDGAVIVKSGALVSVSGKDMPLSGTARVRVEGGTMDTGSGSFSLTNGAVCTIAGGTFKVTPGGLKVSDDSEFSFLGGTVVTPGGANGTVASGAIVRILPPEGATLATDSSNEKALSMYTPRDYAFAGTIAVTNGGFYVSSYANTTDIVHIFGRGDILADEINWQPQKTGGKVHFDLSALALGAHGISVLSHAGQMHFLNGVRMGAFADWGVSGSCATGSNFYFYGPVEFATCDALDHEMARTITLLTTRLESVTSLKVSGGGMVNLGVRANAVPDGLNALSLTDASTLNLSACSNAVRTQSLTVGIGSTLAYRPTDGCWLDAAATAAVSGTLKLEASDEAASAARYPVYFAPTGTEPDLAMFDASELPSGLSLARRDNVVYLTDGSADAVYQEAGDDTHYNWTGAAGGNWQTAENWANGKVPGTSTDSKYLSFGGWKNLVMTNSNSSTRPTRITVAADAGPFLLRGESIRIISSDSIYSYSQYPVVFETLIGKPSGSGDLGVYALGAGYVAMTGGARQTGKDTMTNDFSFAGDVRLGQTWKFKRLVSSSDKKSVIPTRLTLLSGASLTTYEKDLSIAEAVSFVVGYGATFRVDNPSFGFGVENTHIVDGTWTVVCPFSATAKQTIRGAGTLKVASLAAAAGGIEIAETVKLVPGDWTEAAKVFFRDTPTVKTEAGTTIGEAVSFELEPHATLTVDTADGDLVMETPILGGGDVVKTGANALVLNCAGNVVDTLTVSGGTVKPGPALVAAADAGYVPFLTVKTLVGELAIDNAKVVATVNADGTTTYSFKNKHGMMLLVR